MMNWRQFVTQENGIWKPNSKYLGALAPFTMGIDPANKQTAQTLLPLTINANAPIPVGFPFCRTSYDGGFEGQLLTFEDSTAGTANAQWTVRFEDVVNGMQLMNDACHVRTIFGTAQLPAIINEPLTIFMYEKLQVLINLIAGNANTTGRINLPGAVYMPTTVEQQAFINDRVAKWTERRKYVFPYWYTISPAPASLTALQSLSFDIKIGDHFEAFKLAAVSTGEFSWKISDTLSSKVLSNGMINSVAGLGDATFPFVFDRPFFTPKGGKIRITLTDISNANNAIWLVLSGRKIVGVPFDKVEQVLQDTQIDPSFDDQYIRADYHSGVQNQVVGA